MDRPSRRNSVRNTNNQTSADTPRARRNANPKKSGSLTAIAQSGSRKSGSDTEPKPTTPTNRKSGGLLYYYIFLGILLAAVATTGVFRDRLQTMIFGRQPQQPVNKKFFQITSGKPAAWLNAGDNIVGIMTSSEPIGGEIRFSADSGIQFVSPFGLKAYLPNKIIKSHTGEAAKATITSQLASYAAQVFSEAKDGNIPKTELAALFFFALNNNLEPFAREIYGLYDKDASAIASDYKSHIRKLALQNSIWKKIIITAPEKQTQIASEVVLKEITEDAEATAAKTSSEKVVSLVKENDTPENPEQNKNPEPDNSLEKPQPEEQLNPILVELRKLLIDYDKAMKHVLIARGKSGRDRNSNYGKAGDIFKSIQVKVEKIKTKYATTHPKLLKHYETELENLEQKCGQGVWECMRFSGSKH